MLAKIKGYDPIRNEDDAITHYEEFVKIARNSKDFNKLFDATILFGYGDKVLLYINGYRYLDYLQKDLDRMYDKHKSKILNPSMIKYNDPIPTHLTLCKVMPRRKMKDITLKDIERGIQMYMPDFIANPNRRRHNG